jgi:hypothetical protein
MSIGLNVVNSNRLVSDVNSYERRGECFEQTQSINDVKSDMQSDLYREDYYESNDGLTVIRNNLEEYDTSLTITSFGSPVTNETLFILTDIGSKLSGKLDNCPWNYKSDLVEWDGELINSVGTTNTLMLYQLSVTKNDDYGLESIYNLDYYTTLPSEISGYDPQLGKRVGILVEMQNNAVVGYYILNSNIENYTQLTAFNFKAEEVISIYKNSLNKQVPITGTTLTQESTGHSIKFKFDNMSEISGQVVGHNYMVINNVLTELDIPAEQSTFDAKIGMGINEVDIEIYGTDAFLLKLNYQKLVKN